MKSLRTLIKLQKTRVDEQRLILSKIQEHLDRLETEIVQLELQRVQEHLLIGQHPELGLTYGDYIKKTIAKSRELEKLKQAAVTAVEIARDRLASLFEEQKRYEVAEDHRQKALLAEENRRETIELDEVGGITHQRKQSATTL